MIRWTTIEVEASPDLPKVQQQRYVLTYASVVFVIYFLIKLSRCDELERRFEGRACQAPSRLGKQLQRCRRGKEVWPVRQKDVQT